MLNIFKMLITCVIFDIIQIVKAGTLLEYFFSLLDYIGGVSPRLVQHSSDSITLDFADTPGILFVRAVTLAVRPVLKHNSLFHFQLPERGQLIPTRCICT